MDHTTPPAADEPGCAELVRDLADLLDDEVDPSRRPGFERHLERCAHCLAIYRHERSLLDRLRAGLRSAAVPDELGRRVLEAIQRQLDPGAGQ